VSRPPKNYISCKVSGICASGRYPFVSHFRSLFPRFTHPNVMHQCADFVSQLCMPKKNQKLKEQKRAAQGPSSSDSFYMFSDCFLSPCLAEAHIHEWTRDEPSVVA
jgi:hypothetical protein